MYVFSQSGKSYGVILPPKTATRSYEQALRKIGAKAHGGRHGCPVAIRERQDVLVSSVRHPCDVLVSWYHYDRAGKRSGRTFGEYVGFVVGGGNSYTQKTTMPGAEFATVFLRYEDGPHEAWNTFLESIGKEPFAEFEHKGKAPDREDWQDYFSDGLFGVVREKYKRDFERFGYESRFLHKAA